MKRAVAAGAVGVALAGGGLARAAVPVPGIGPQLTVLGVAAPVASAGSPVAVRVVIHNSATPLACRPFQVTLWWKSATGRPHQRTSYVPSTLDAEATTVQIPGWAVQAGTLSYAVTVTQSCGFLTPYRTYRGRSPQVGANSVTVLG